MINKPTIIITSLGRTGTLFFAFLFRELFPGCTSLHEPDVFTTDELHRHGGGWTHILRQIREAGFMNKVVRKSLGMWSLAAISDGRVRRQLTLEQAAKKVISQRNQFVQSRPGSLYVESAQSYYGIVDVLKGVYRSHKVAYFIRDGREWVNSRLNWEHKGGMYSKRGFRKLIGHRWPTPLDTGDEIFGPQWHSMTNFEKLCWAWSNLNEYAINSIAVNPDARLFYFEDIFQSPEKEDHLADLINFTIEGKGGLVYDKSLLSANLRRQIHASTRRNSSWDGWTAEQQDQFNRICGPLMEKMKYQI